MSQGVLCPNLSQKVQKEVFQMANRNLSRVILLGGLSVNLNHLKTSSTRRTASEGARPLRIPPADSKWAFFHNWAPTYDLTGDGEPTDIMPQGTSTPIKAAPVPERRSSGKKLNASKIKASHLLFDMQDRQEKARKNIETENQAMVPDQTSGEDPSSSGKCPHGLPVTLPNLVGAMQPTGASGGTPAPSPRGSKRPLDDDVDETAEILDGDEPAGPPKKKKKKKKKNKNKDAPEDEVLDPEDRDDEPRPSTSTEPGIAATEPTPVPEISVIPEEGEEAHKKKKKHKKDASHEKWKVEQRKAIAKEMAKALHRPIQRKQDFKAVRNYRKGLSPDLLETINGADHSGFLLEKMKLDDGNYMSQKNGHDRNLMSVKRLLTRIAKYATEPEKRLREAQQFINSTFPMVQGMPSRDKCSPELVVRVLMDCHGNVIDCDHREYSKEQNLGLHDVISQVAMARVTARETHVVKGIPTTIKTDHAYCPFCSYTASNHRPINNHVRMHFRAIFMCGWPGCFFVHMQSFRMIEHSSKVHGMARAKPAREKDAD